MAEDYSIGKAAQLSGLTTFLIRAWENRYNMAVPRRNEGGQRRYTDTDVERLRKLSRLVTEGHRIGDIVRLSDSVLDQMLTEKDSPIRTDFVETALGVTEAFDAPGLQAVLEGALSELGPMSLADQVVFPFLEGVGRYWHENRIRMMHEHLASTVVSALFGRILAGYAPADGCPRAVVATPPGQEHNIGAACCAVAAADAGWGVRHLGTHIPAQEMIAAVREFDARLLLLSIVFPARGSAVKEALDILERDLPKDVELLVGGASAGAFLSGAGGRAEKAPATVAELRDRLAHY